MIFAQYKNDEVAKVFTIEIANTEFSAKPFSINNTVAVFKPVNATYHLENAINKAFDGNNRPGKFHIKINDPNNHYLKLIGIAIASYIRGLGYSYPDLETENF